MQDEEREEDMDPIILLSMNRNPKTLTLRGRNIQRIEPSLSWFGGIDLNDGAATVEPQACLLIGQESRRPCRPWPV